LLGPYARCYKIATGDFAMQNPRHAKDIVSDA